MEAIIILLLLAVAYLIMANFVILSRLRKADRNIVDLENELYKEENENKQILEDFKNKILYAVNESQLAQFAYSDILTLNAKVEQLEKFHPSGIPPINTEQYDLSKPLITKTEE